jgi:hypothetical protein
LKLPVRFQPAAEVSGTAAYSQNDFSLEYRHAGSEVVPQTALDQSLGIRPDPPWFAISDALTLEFSPEGALQALDAYTNRDQWENAAPDMESPAIAGVGRLLLADLPWPDDRRTLDDTPTFAYNERTNLLLITFARSDVPTTHYRISDRAIVGVAGDALISMFLEGLGISIREFQWLADFDAHIEEHRAPSRVLGRRNGAREYFCLEVQGANGVTNHVPVFSEGVGTPPKWQAYPGRLLVGFSQSIAVLETSSLDLIRRTELPFVFRAFIELRGRDLVLVDCEIAIIAIDRDGQIHWTVQTRDLILDFEVQGDALRLTLDDRSTLAINVDTGNVLERA